MGRQNMRIEGKPVKDAKRRMYVEVKPVDVAKGKTKSPVHCVTAKALIRSGICTAARVHLTRAYIQRGRQWIRYATPPHLTKEIIAYDKGGKFEPGMYELLPIPTVDRSENRSAKRKANKSKPSHPQKKSLGLRQRHVTANVRPHA